MMQINVPYPDRESERQILFATTGEQETKPRNILTSEQVQAAQNLVRRMPIGESVVEAILNLVRSARPGNKDNRLNSYISWGPGPRASPGNDAGSSCTCPADWKAGSFSG